MMQVVRDFVIDASENLPIAGPIVEVGSRPAEGQEEMAFLRPLFGGMEYIGCDIQPGQNVDQIEDIHALSFADDSVGTVISVETLEHVADPHRGVQEIHRILKPGGVAIITSVMFMPIHNHPWDFWRFTPEGFAKLLEPFETSFAYGLGFDLLPESVFGIGVKGPFEDLSLDRFPRSKANVENWGRGLPVDMGPFRFTLPQIWKFTLRATVDSAKRRAERYRSRSSSSKTSH
jgi:SAM-dependent methyltransferase